MKSNIFSPVSPIRLRVDEVMLCLELSDALTTAKFQVKKCYFDLNHHYVVTFLADVPESELSALKGLKGDYHGRILGASMTSTIDSYIKNELRSLESFPLDLTENEIQRFIKLVSEKIGDTEPVIIL